MSESGPEPTPQPAPEAAAPTDRRPDHSRVVVTTIVIWVAAHVLLLTLIGVPAYAQCAAATTTNTLFGGCSVPVGLTALAIGWIQLAYGLIGAVIVYATGHHAISQGMFIAAPIVAFTFTVVCFGSVFVAN